MIPNDQFPPRRLELRRIDPGRWALLHGPFGILASVPYVAVNSREASRSDQVVLVLFYAIYFGLAIMAAAGVQAWLLNLFLGVMRRGPVFEVADPDEPVEVATELQAHLARAQRERIPLGRTVLTVIVLWLFCGMFWAVAKMAG